MNIKERLILLNKYATHIKDRLEAPVPKKHADHPKQFKAFLEKELKAVLTKVGDLKLTEK